MSLNNKPYPRFSPTFLLFALILLGGVLRAYQLDRTLGGFDENHYLIFFGFTSLKEIATSYFNASNHVFHTILVRLMMSTFGEDSEIAIRFPSFAAGIACLGMIYKLAELIFNSSAIARMALLIAVISPTHILYSQTARGYSLMMFLSVSLVYATLKILENKHLTQWGVVAVIAGFLSVYTLPTNIYFIFSLACWVFLVLFIPKWSSGFDYQSYVRKRICIAFLVIFGFTALFTLLVYLPLLDEMVEVAKYDINYAQNEYGLKQNPILGVFLQVLPQSVLLIFKNPLHWFLPVLVIGVFSGKTSRTSYRLLPPCVLFIPLILILLTGVSGYPRNYLFNLPVLIIFMAGGIARIGRFLGSLLKHPKAGEILINLFLLGYVLISASLVLPKHYTSLRTESGDEYRKKVQEHTNPLDLIAIADSNHFLYAREVYRKNVKNIISENKMAGIKLIISKDLDFNNYQIPTSLGMVPLLQGLFDKNKLSKQDISGGKNLISLADSKSTGLLPKNFNTVYNWHILSGSGTLKNNYNQSLTGSHSLLLQAEQGKNLVVGAVFPNPVKIQKQSLLVMIWSAKNSKTHGPVNDPLITAKIKAGDTIENLQLIMGKINFGIRLRLKKERGLFNDGDWPVYVSLGKLPPGEYIMSLLLNCTKGNSVIYDSLQVYIVEISDSFLSSNIE